MAVFKNKKTLVAVFAHPDDEAFGPGGSLIHFARKYDVYLICATNGDNPVRKKELEAAAVVMGIKRVDWLHFKDGGLNNNNYHQLATAISKKIKQYRPETLIIAYPNRIIANLIDLFNLFSPDVSKLGLQCSV